MKEVALAVGLPLIGIGLTITWKVVLRYEKSDEDYVAILEILMATLVFSVAVWANDTGHRSPQERTVASIASFVVALSLIFAGALVKRAYDPNETFTRRRAAVVDGLGLVVFAVVYLAVNGPGTG